MGKYIFDHKTVFEFINKILHYVVKQFSIGRFISFVFLPNIYNALIWASINLFVLFVKVSLYLAVEHDQSISFSDFDT